MRAAAGKDAEAAGLVTAAAGLVTADVDGVERGEPAL